MYWMNITKTLKRILSLIASLISFVFLLAIIGSFLAVFLVDTIKPATLFNPYVLFPIIITLIAFDAYVTFKGSAAKTKCRWLDNWSRKKKMVSLTLLISLSVIVPLAIRGANYLNDQRLLEQATMQFLVETRSEAPQGQIDNTLIELQRQLTDLRSKYVKEPPDYLIRVRMFTDVSELHAETSSPDWADAYVRTTPGQAPIIYLPVEPESQRFDKAVPTPIPAHEITHVVTYEALKLRSMNLIPKFLRESLAQYESLGGLLNLFDRLIIRVFLLTLEPSVSLCKTPPKFDYAASQTDMDIFYALSYEYARFLVDKYGADMLWQVVQEVGNGTDFNVAFFKVTNKQYSASYIEFTRQWLTAPVIMKYYELRRSSF